MSDPDINELARKQAVQEERGDSMRREYSSGFDRVASEIQQLCREIQANFDRLNARMEATEARMEASEARMEAKIAQGQNRIILWVIGWVTGLAVLGYTVVRPVLG